MIPRFVATLAVAAVMLQPPQASYRIRLNVAAFDSHGQPVGDLNGDDFQVTDQGKPQHILTFSRNQDLPQLNNSRTESGIGLPPILILFDLLNANMSNRNLAEQELDQSLEHLESSDSVYLYILTNAGSLYPIHPLQEPGAEVPTSAHPWTEQIRPMLKTAIDQVYGMRPMDEREAGIRIQTTYQALEALASKLQEIPGRKNMIWVTPGVAERIRLANGDWFDFTPRLHRFAAAMDRDDISLTTVERGDAPGSRDEATVQEFAQLTGGQVLDSNLDKAISTIQAEARSGYVIEYAAPSPDGKYHKIKVTSTHKGVRIQTKQGYYADHR